MWGTAVVPWDVVGHKAVSPIRHTTLQNIVVHTKVRVATGRMLSSIQRSAALG